MDQGDNSISYDEEELIREMFVGKSVHKVASDRLELSDGTRLRLVGNVGCFGCDAGNFHLTELNACENIITNVEVSQEHIGLYDEAFHLFVFADNQRINLAEFAGSEGFGHYGTGFWIEVEADHDTEPAQA